jgi:hypothetical protein
MMLSSDLSGRQDRDLRAVQDSSDELVASNEGQENLKTTEGENEELLGLESFGDQERCIPIRNAYDRRVGS